MSVLEVGASIRYGEVAALLRGLMTETSTHYYASINGWDWASSIYELTSIAYYEAKLNAGIEDESQRIKLPRPWGDDKPKREVVTDAELEALVARLNANSAFRDSE